MAREAEVAIVKVDEYGRLDEAVAAALDLIGARELIGAEDNVLFKPNLLLKLRNACTEGDFIRAVARYVKQSNPDIRLGDSPAQFRSRARNIIKSLGIEIVLEEEGITYTEFESGGVLVDNPDGKQMRRFHLARPVMDADLVINLPRPKSHVEAVYTGAVKNFWGIIPGGEKAQCHLYGKNLEQFGETLVDNYQTLLNLGKKQLTVMDARTFMEGLGGPASGPLRRVGVIIAGRDAVAVDVVALAIGRADALKAVPHLRGCENRGLGTTRLEAMRILGKQIEEVRLKRRIGITASVMADFIGFFSRRFAHQIMRRLPSLNKSACTQCGDCYHICPNQAVSWQKKQYPVFDREKCISCLCCLECCLQRALQAKGAGLSGLFLEYPEVNPPRHLQPGSSGVERAGGKGEKTAREPGSDDE